MSHATASRLCSVEGIEATERYATDVCPDGAHATVTVVRRERLVETGESLPLVIAVNV